MKNGYFDAIIFQDIEFFEHFKYNFKTSWPQKISIFKKHFTAKITLILTIKKMPLTFLDVEKQSTYDLFYVCTSEALQQVEVTKKSKIKFDPSIFMEL